MITKRNFFVLVLFILVAMFFIAAGNKPITFSGTQKRGTGPLDNASTKSQVLIVETQAKIIKVEGSSRYCIWKKGKNMPYLCSQKKKDLIGKILPKGEYTILPGLSKYQYTATTTITVECTSCKVKTPKTKP